MTRRVLGCLGDRDLAVLGAVLRPAIQDAAVRGYPRRIRIPTWRVRCANVRSAIRRHGQMTALTVIAGVARRTHRPVVTRTVQLVSHARARLLDLVG